jgi:RimJ/RimL family protein N-acetyltransferase
MTNDSLAPTLMREKPKKENSENIEREDGGGGAVTVTCRKLSIHDIDLFRTLLKDPDVRRNTWLQIPEEAETDEILRYCFLKGYQRYILENEEGSTVGTFSFQKDGCFAGGGIFILPEFRGKGYGKAAFRARAEILRGHGIRFLRNEIFTDNLASIQTNLKNNAREFGWWALRIPIMKSKHLTTQTKAGRIELSPFCSGDTNFYRKLFQEESVQFQTYSEEDLTTCSEEGLVRFLMTESDRRWTVWLHQENSKTAIGTTHLYGRRGPCSNFGFLIGAEHRGKGFGRATLQLLKIAAQDEGIRILRADVFFESKAAIACLEGSGFRPFGFYETFLS